MPTNSPLPLHKREVSIYTDRGKNVFSEQAQKGRQRLIMPQENGKGQRAMLNSQRGYEENALEVREGR